MAYFLGIPSGFVPIVFSPPAFQLQPLQGRDSCVVRFVVQRTGAPLYGTQAARHASLRSGVSWAGGLTVVVEHFALGGSFATKDKELVAVVLSTHRPRVS